MSLKILIIEDQAIVGLYMKRAIKSMGHKVLMVVNNASDAFKIAQKNRIDLLISTIHIQSEPKGVQYCSILQSKYKIPVVFVTEYGNKNRVKEITGIDFIVCLEKPFNENELKTMINLAI